MSKKRRVPWSLKKMSPLQIKALGEELAGIEGKYLRLWERLREEGILEIWDD